MKLIFSTNDYLLIWNLLYGSSFSENVHTFKQRLYQTHKNHYKSLEKDKDEMLLDIKNFIPDDDTLYNLVLESELFSNLKKETEEHRDKLFKIWDQYKKRVDSLLKSILKFPLKEEYHILVLHPMMDSILTAKNANSIGWGRANDLKNPVDTMIHFLSYLIRQEIGDYNIEYREIVDAILELVLNELYTELTGTSNYLKGDKTLSYLKSQIYPYWLMYLGYEKEDFPRFMMRDKIVFEIEHYPVDKNIMKMNLFDFIDFCVRNQRRIVRIHQLEII